MADDNTFNKPGKKYPDDGGKGDKTYPNDATTPTTYTPEARTPPCNKKCPHCGHPLCNIYDLQKCPNCGLGIND